mmetsp:Transcript_13428/g.57248  ORF Transcript_13428/g.57248 Transcript_13428/m.57248 type:complete len:270 (+) Transcript_13428:2123-2932(+)
MNSSCISEAARSASDSAATPPSSSATVRAREPFSSGGSRVWSRSATPAAISAAEWHRRNARSNASPPSSSSAPEKAAASEGVSPDVSSAVVGATVSLPPYGYPFVDEAKVSSPPTGANQDDGDAAAYAPAGLSSTSERGASAVSTANKTAVLLPFAETASEPFVSDPFSISAQSAAARRSAAADEGLTNGAPFLCPNPPALKTSPGPTRAAAVDGREGHRGRTGAEYSERFPSSRSRECSPPSGRLGIRKQPAAVEGRAEWFRAGFCAK